MRLLLRTWRGKGVLKKDEGDGSFQEGRGGRWFQDGMRARLE